MNSDGEGVVYRLEVAGRVPASWQERFGAHAMWRSGANTVLEVRVRDQSELFGRLRRVHDLNLHLVAVALMPGDAEEGG